DRASPERRAARADGLQRDPAPADADHRHLRHERPLPRLRHVRGVVGRSRRDVRRAPDPARLLPIQALPLTKQLWAPWRLEYIQSADEQDGCFLCAAALGDDDEALPVVRRGGTAFVVLNKFPYSSRHLLVAPRRHGVDFGELDDTEVLEIHRLAAAAIAALRTSMHPDGFNLGWNLG